MKKIAAILLSSALFLGLVSCQPGSPKKGERLLMGGSGWNKLVIIDKNTKQIEWEYPIQPGWECNSSAVTPDGNILFSYQKGAKVITRDKQDVWNIEAPEGCEMQTARVLPDGKYLLAWCGSPATILEVNPDGSIASQTEFETGIENPHAQFRQINKNKNGNYLVPLFATSEVREISPAGETVKSVTVGGTPFCIAPLNNGNYLVACGDAHKYIELNYETGEVVRTVNINDIEGTTLAFVAQLLPAKDGGLYVCNWQGHESPIEGNPQLIELDANGKVVWSLTDNATFGMISNLCPID